MKKKKSKLSLAALILGVIAFGIQMSAMSSAGSAGGDAEKVGMALGMAIVAPSFFMLIAGVILNAIGFLMTQKVLTLISAIFYTLSLVLFPLWGFVAIPSMILQYVAFAKMGKTTDQAVVDSNTLK